MARHLGGRITSAAAVAASSVFGLSVMADLGCARPSIDRREPLIALAGAPGGSSTSRADLQETVTRLRARLGVSPGNSQASILLADALLRQTRVVGNAGLANEAERVLWSALRANPDDYAIHRMLAAVYASQHRFREALAEGRRCLAVRTDDAWVYGVMGDAHLELGEYPEAFAAFDRMAARRPNAASYARTSYARELQGDLQRALRDMQMATEATSAQDPESLAWHHAQLGHLYFELGHIAKARREYAHADFVFPDHPFAVEGLARVAAAEGDYVSALDRLNRAPAVATAPAMLAMAGDLLTAMGRRGEAERQYRLAEAAWQADAPDPPKLSRFLAERGRRLDDALRLAETAAVDRHDIFTADALAWAAFQNGQLDRASAAIATALSTGSRDRVIRYHAAAIARATGQTETARRLVADALDGAPGFDSIAAPAAATLKESLDAPALAHR